MNTALDLSRLETVKDRGGKTTARCPVCAAAGNDKAGDHLVIMPGGKFGCIAYPGDAGSEHRKQIFSMAGVVEKTEAPRPAQSKPGKTYPTPEQAAKAIAPQGAEFECVHVYLKSSKPFGAVARYRAADGKTMRQLHPEGGGWAAGGPSGKWPLLYAEKLPEAGKVHVFEGEVKTDMAALVGLAALCPAGGAGAADKSDWGMMAGRDVCLWLDRDDPGEKWGATIAAILTGLTPAARVKIVRVPYAEGTGKDIADYLTDGAGMDDIDGLVAAAPEWKPTPADSTTPESGFPAIVSAAVFTAAPMPEPAQVIHGVLHAGSKAVYGGPSKAFKSWSLLDMSLAVATGGDWLGFPTTRGRVLYVNFELQPFALHRRLHAIATARGCRIGDNLDLWNLRGHGCPMTRLLPDLLRRVEGEGYSLIIPDPIYKTLDGRNENDAGDIGGLCGELEAVAVQTGAAVAFGAHFAKGNAGGKESIDRVSGSGVWARDPDAIITATPHEEDGAFTVEMTLRNFPPPMPFVVRWEYPRMMPDTGLDPEKLRKPKSGRPATYTPADIVKHLKNGMTSTQWQKDCRAEGGIPEKSFYRLLDTVRQTGQAVKTGREWSRGAV